MENFRDFLAEIYPYLKIIHLASLISWMAGMFYLPRLFVYHAEATVGGELSQTLKVMESKLLRLIMNPAMILTFLTGGLLVMIPGMLWEGAGWFHAKFLLVLLMAGCHGYLAKTRKVFERDENVKSHKHFRVVNEIPTVLLLLILFLVVIKPF